MARDLSDVLHYFLEDAPPSAHGAAAPLLAVPLARGETLRSALTQALASELAERGLDVALLVPSVNVTPQDGLPGIRPVRVACGSQNLGDLRAAAMAWAAKHRERGLALVQVPAEWLDQLQPCDPLLGWVLLLAEPGDRRSALDLCLRLGRCGPSTQIGVTVHGVHSIDEGEALFETLAREVEGSVGRRLSSYGLVLDDLEIARALVTGRAMDSQGPGQDAARSLRDVAHWLHEDLATLA